MSIFIRAILIVGLLLQTGPGLVMERCVAMPTVSELVAEGMAKDAMCRCCVPSGAAAAVECPMAKWGYAGCNCKHPQQDEPKTPPSNEKSRQIGQLFSALTPVAAMPLAEAMPLPVRWTVVEPSNRSGSNSTQSLLCVWVM